MKPDTVLLDQSRNNLGERPVNFDTLTSAPKENPFRIQEVEHLEELVESLQVSRAEMREAVFTGNNSVAMLNGPFAKALESGQTVQPGDRIQIFWPTDVVNDYIKVKTNTDRVVWLKYVDSKSEPQIILLEDFVIPQVFIKDSRLVVISEKTEKVDEPTIVLTSDEKVKNITYVEIDVDQEVNEDKEPDENRVEIENQNKRPVSIEVDLTPNFGEPKSEITIVDAPTRNPHFDEISESKPQAVVRPRARPVNIDHKDAKGLSEFAPRKSPRPVARPAKPPLLEASGMDPEQLLADLGIEETKISRNESVYIRNGQKRISEVFSDGHKTFSGCTFDLAQGSQSSKCYRKLVLSKEYTRFLEKEGLACANDAAKLVFNEKPLKVMLRTNGGSVNRSGNTRSLHPVGRALDVFKVYLYFKKSSSPEEIVFHKNKIIGSSDSVRRNYNFYWAFESCWTKKIKEHKQAKSCGIRGSGALTYKTNLDHYDHMHISLPVCKGVKKEFNLFDS